MTDSTKDSVDIDVANSGNGKNNKSINKFLIISACVLVVALAASAVLLLAGEAHIVRVMDYGTVLQGVSVGGIDISGMTEEEALEAAASIPEDLLDQVEISIDIDGDIVTYEAEEIGVYTDYEEVITQALIYGRSGTINERKQANEIASSEGVDFSVQVYIDNDYAASVLNELKETMDAEAVDASYIFMPDGYYLIDGVPYTPDEYEALKTEAEENGTEFEETELVQLSTEDQPIDLRYLYWDNDEYVDGYIPQDAYIARFYYIEEVKGMVIDIEPVIEQVISAVENNDYSTIVASVEVTEPDVTIDEIKDQTQLITSWTSSYSDHNSASRVFNVAKLSGIISGVEIESGEEWSINEEAGARTIANGWKNADGISGGAYVPQPGGGVCQISSTTYNAALRANLEIVESSRHSIVSNYIPIGLDATISTGGPDLVLKNNNETSVFIVSYLNKDDQNVTVEIYGTPVVDEEYGEVILDFTSVDLGTKGSGTMYTYYNVSVAPDGTAIAPGTSYVYAKARSGSAAQTYKHWYDLEGNELNVEEFYYHWYKPINGKTYVNNVDPATVTPTPEDTTDTTDDQTTTTDDQTTTTDDQTTTTDDQTTTTDGQTTSADQPSDQSGEVTG